MASFKYTIESKKKTIASVHIDIDYGVELILPHIICFDYQKTFSINYIHCKESY